MLSEEDKQAISELMPAVERRLKREIPSWPRDACADSAFELLPLLREKLGNHGLRWKLVNGYFNDSEHWEEGHTWIETAAGEIVDPTAGQFLDGPALRVFAAGDERYLARRR